MDDGYSSSQLWLIVIFFLLFWSLLFFTMRQNQDVGYTCAIENSIALVMALVMAEAIVFIVVIMVDGDADLTQLHVDDVIVDTGLQLLMHVLLMAMVILDTV